MRQGQHGHSDLSAATQSHKQQTVHFDTFLSEPAFTFSATCALLWDRARKASLQVPSYVMPNIFHPLTGVIVTDITRQLFKRYDRSKIEQIFLKYCNQPLKILYLYLLNISCMSFLFPVQLNEM